MNKRAEKWASKLSGANRKRLYDIQKPRMVELEKIASENFEKIELRIKEMTRNEPVIYQHFYMAFAKQIYKLINKSNGQTLINELIILEEIWRNRGLDPDKLDEIKMFYVTPYIKIYEELYKLWCRFDVGLFDVNTFR